MGRKKILLIEDSLDFRQVFKAWLETDYDVVCSLDRDEIESLIPTVDLVLCDYEFSPTLTFEQVRDMVAGSRPLILCSGVYREGWTCQVPKTEASTKLRPLISDLLRQCS